MNNNWPLLIQQYISGDILDADAARLEAQLKEHPALLDLYLDAVQLDSALAATAEATTMAHQLGTAAHPSLPSATSVTRGNASRSLPRRHAIAAIAAACAVLLALWQQSTQAEVEFEVVRVSDPSNSPWKAGDRVKQHSVHWADGSLEIRLNNGILLTLQGPAKLTFQSGMELRLLDGRITANVGDHGKGFIIETANHRIVDLGTVFGVDATRTAKTDVVVFNGQVEVHEKGSSQPALLLSQGEGIRLERNRRSSRIVSVNGPDASGAWSAASPTPTALISAVSDSMSADEAEAAKWPSLRNFYRIVPQGLTEGSLAFSDTLDEWSHVPPSLVGADQVRTFAVDRYNWWMRLTLDLAHPAELFVMVDQRNPVPRWVSESFTPTGETIILDFKPDQARGTVVKRFPYDVWSRRVETPGTITLGAPYENPPADRKSFSPNNMFGIAAKALR